MRQYLADKCCLGLQNIPLILQVSKYLQLSEGSEWLRQLGSDHYVANDLATVDRFAFGSLASMDWLSAFD